LAGTERCEVLDPRPLKRMLRKDFSGLLSGILCGFSASAMNNPG